MSASLLDKLVNKIAGTFAKTTEKPNSSLVIYGAIGLVGSFGVAVCYNYFKKQTAGKILYNRPIDINSEDRLGADEQNLHHLRRSLTYPPAVANSWYHLVDSDALKSDGQVLQVKALGRVFALWRTADGTPVCQDAYCIHLGANLAVGGRVTHDEKNGSCIECPFHKWKFGSDGSIMEVPYLKDSSVLPAKKLKTFPVRDYCGLVLIFFDHEQRPPSWEPPAFIVKELEEGGWIPHMKWDIGFKTLSPVDWVDQAGDYAHFHTLHADLLLPWTMIPMPQWLLRWLPVGIRHKLHTMRGDDKEWSDRVSDSGWGVAEKHYIYFTDLVGLTWNGEIMESTMSETVEMFIGPAMMIFNIPFTVGSLKAYVTTTPVDGGSIMRVRTWVDKRVADGGFLWWRKAVAYLVTGISASQLLADIDIMSNKIRMRKPILQPFDGPYGRTNAWLKMFYSDTHYVPTHSLTSDSTGGGGCGGGGVGGGGAGRVLDAGECSMRSPYGCDW